MQFHHIVQCLSDTHTHTEDFTWTTPAIQNVAVLAEYISLCCSTCSKMFMGRNVLADDMAYIVSAFKSIYYSDAQGFRSERTVMLQKAWKSLNNVHFMKLIKYICMALSCIMGHKAFACITHVVNHQQPWPSALSITIILSEIFVYIYARIR